LDTRTGNFIMINPHIVSMMTGATSVTNRKGDRVVATWK